MAPRRLRPVLVCCALLLLLPAAAAAGELYRYDGDPNYWWYVDGSPRFEVLIPSDRSAINWVEIDWGGSTSMQVVIGEGGPMIVVGTLPTTDAAAAWNALSAPWAARTQSARTTTNSQITTDQGLNARFFVLEGGGNMVRMVAFTRSGRLAYLLFVGKSADYSGSARQHWLRAVHSFRWL